MIAASARSSVRGLPDRFVGSSVTKKACAAAANTLGVGSPSPDTKQVPYSLSEGMHILKSLWQATSRSDPAA